MGTDKECEERMKKVKGQFPAADKKFKVLGDFFLPTSLTKEKNKELEKKKEKTYTEIPIIMHEFEKLGMTFEEIDGGKVSANKHSDITKLFKNESNEDENNKDKLIESLSKEPGFESWGKAAFDTTEISKKIEFTNKDNEKPAKQDPIIQINKVVKTL